MKYIVEFEDEPCMYEDEVHYYKCIQAPWWGLSERVIKQLTPYQPDAPDANVGNITNSCGHEKDLISRQAALDAISAWRRDYPLDLQEPIDDCWNSVRELPAVQPDHNADIGKKVSIPCAHENDLIFRQAAIDALARMMPRSYTPDGSHPADEEIFQAQEVFADCIEALEILQPAAPSTAHTTETTAETTAPSTDDWIPVSERMPELDEDGYSGKVLVCFDRVSFCEICEYRTDKWYIGDMEDSPEDIGLRVTAWKPLPEPYRGGDSNE